MLSGKWQPFCLGLNVLTLSGPKMYMSVNRVITRLDNGLSLNQYQSRATNSTNTDLSLTAIKQNAIEIMLTLWCFYL